MTENSRLDKADLSRVVGGNIRKLRLSARISQEELAEKLELSKNFVSLMERGVKFPSAETIVKLCNIFSIEFFELFFDNEKFISGEIKKALADSITEKISSSIIDIVENMTIFKK